MRKLVSIALLFCMLLSTSGCADTLDSDGEKTTSMDSSQNIASETEEQSNDNETAEENMKEETLNMKVQHNGSSAPVPP